MLLLPFIIDAVEIGDLVLDRSAGGEFVSDEEQALGDVGDFPVAAAVLVPRVARCAETLPKLVRGPSPGFELAKEFLAQGLHGHHDDVSAGLIGRAALTGPELGEGTVSR